ncbi:MAG: SGNH/GDSL hydrolase family protein [Sphingomonadales bacterium]|nr:SGNH/GDSL hydrolase family protein [Sphingomonadales bacterium]
MGALFFPRSQPAWRSTLPAQIRPPAVMALPPTVTSSATATLSRQFFPAAHNAYFNVPSMPLGGVFTISRTQPDAAPPGFAAVPGTTITNGTGAPNARGAMQVSFIHDGASFELGVPSAQLGVLVRVDGEFVALTGPAVATTTYQRYDFGSRKVRRIDLIGANWWLASVGVGPTDAIYPATVRGPRVICLGDSFTALGSDQWQNWFADAMGWDDVWSSGIGGTGYVNNQSGTKKTFRARLQSDVVAYKPDIVIIMGSVNDWSQPAAQVASEAAALVAELRASLPGCLVIGAHACSGGVETMNSAALDVMDATRSGFTAAGGIWLNPVQLPFGFNGPTAATLLSGAHAAGRPGNSGVPTAVAAGQGILVDAVVGGSANIRVGATVEIGSGATRERVHLTSFTQASPKALYGFDGALRYAHASGEPVVEVGPSYMTGRGKAGTPTGWGTADLFVSSDGTHPTPEGQRALGMLLAQLVRSHIAGLR